MDLKSALWACGHISTSTAGIELLVESNPINQSVFADIVKLARSCQVYSIRGTAFYVLGLIGCTYDGANVLHELGMYFFNICFIFIEKPLFKQNRHISGWLCVRHNRHERWPIINEEYWLTKSDSEDQIYQSLYEQIKTDNRIVIDTETSENSDKTDHSAADSSNSGNLKLSSGKVLMTSSTIPQSLAEETVVIEIEEKDVDTDSMPYVGVSSEKPERRVKCLTLPQRLYPTSRKHQRSLSESKTVNKIKSDDDNNENGMILDSNMSNENRSVIGRLNSFDLWQDSSRIRNNSESSTSGVSSCDSVLGKYTFKYVQY